MYWVKKTKNIKIQKLAYNFAYLCNVSFMIGSLASPRYNFAAAILKDTTGKNEVSPLQKKALGQMFFNWG